MATAEPAPRTDQPLVECVPNVSEGRDPDVIEAVARAVRAVEGVALLDVDADPWHHRSVYTFVGPPRAVADAAFELVREAAARVDLSRHHGEHPRIGAADVVPFVPLAGLDLGRQPGADMDRCVRLAGRLGERVAEELGIPVFLYGRAARRPERTVPAPFRRGGFEALREAISADPVRAPDLGPRRVHPTAGAMATGARPPLVAYNVLLDTDDVAAAREIARQIRSSGGGLPAVQALGFRVGDGAQVSCNLLDPWLTPPARVFAAVRDAAAERGVGVRSSQVVGLAPEDVLPPGSEEEILLDAPRASRLLEPRIRSAFGDGRARP
jgi:glutamate formiminotransferase